MYFKVIGEIEAIEVIAKGPSVKEKARLIAQFGQGRWRKLKVRAMFALRVAQSAGRRYTGTKLTVLGVGS
jgi:hypothetical protein